MVAVCRDFGAPPIFAEDSLGSHSRISGNNIRSAYLNVRNWPEIASRQGLTRVRYQENRPSNSMHQRQFATRSSRPPVRSCMTKYGNNP